MPKMTTTSTQISEKDLTFKFTLEGGDDRLRELIIYIAQKCEADPGFGATKLNKILYFSDFMAHSITGTPITGTEYQRLQWGPAPRRLKPICHEMEKARDIAFQKRRVFNCVQDRVIALRAPRLNNYFSADEIALVDHVISELWGKSAAETSALSHGRAWKLVTEGESIPYEASLISDTCVTDDELEWVREVGPACVAQIEAATRGIGVHRSA